MNGQRHKFLEFESSFQRANARFVFLFASLYGCGFIAVALGHALVGFLVLIAVFIPLLIKTSRGIRLGRQTADDASVMRRKYDQIVLIIAIVMPSAINIVRDLSRAGAVVLAVIATVVFYFLAQSWYGGFKDTAELVRGDSSECIEQLTDDQLSYLAVLWAARCAVGFQEITQIFITRGIVSVFEEYGPSGQKDVAWVQLTEHGCGLAKNLERVSSHS
ncbi:hypothetical protein [Corynebacterium diphtheriae]|uniref:hypothetical protein n=1 Tax=Corynebacterium diphtheriae TaxID=1717 RepID=UPI00038F2BDC|nr:hypothetical protein [Corynebacterium diphtheriae]ERA53312.1 integral membrane protein [Corynebacterium diphtheriae str. Aberdeen]KLN41905.1 membrane protein [Corynebacterium diphtheriae bv. gravis str. ISS 4746]KLN44519.1 membrane protein [Corynebacterium diphtheriae bv. gravis str. ISS 4749]MBG9245920.1 hypothetical protein [Corynebacterium diphtheriae bv. mitis]MBG9369284.1 hypothetical protein [Corynebacterium diphtheriae bv. gravis]